MNSLAAEIHELAAQFCADRNRVMLTPTIVEAAMLEAVTLAFRSASADARQARKQSNLPN